jgi:hypothetical protein
MRAEEPPRNVCTGLANKTYADNIFEQNNTINQHSLKFNMLAPLSRHEIQFNMVAFKSNAHVQACFTPDFVSSPK